jgi:hypothetical protein
MPFLYAVNNTRAMTAKSTEVSLPLAVGKRARLKTVITKTEAKGLLVSLKTDIEQNRLNAIRATGRFYISDVITP